MHLIYLFSRCCILDYSFQNNRSPLPWQHSPSLSDWGLCYLGPQVCFAICPLHPVFPVVHLAHHI